MTGAGAMMTDGAELKAKRSMRRSVSGIVFGVAIINAFTGAEAEAAKTAFARACNGARTATVQIATPWRPVTGCITGLAGQDGNSTGRFQALVPIRPASGTVVLSVEPAIVVLTGKNGATLRLDDFQVTDSGAPAQLIEGVFFKEAVVSARARATVLEPGDLWDGYFMIVENY